MLKTPIFSPRLFKPNLKLSILNPIPFLILELFLIYILR